MEKYTFDAISQTLTISAKFNDKMNNPDSEEYKLMMRFRADFPNLTIAKKTHKTPTKYTSKSTGEVFKCNQFKNLKYENMEGFINGLSNSEKYMKAYNFLKNCGSLPQTSRYTVVRKWFVAQFPEFRKNPLFYLYNDVDVISIIPYIEEEQNHIIELNAKKAEQKNVG